MHSGKRQSPSVQSQVCKPRRSVRSENSHGDIWQRAFSAAGPATWNSLPAEIRQSETLTVFKSKLKTFLFTKSYPVK